jgi:hypothetical protein
MAGLSVRHPQRKSLRLALLKRSSSRAIGVPLLALLSQSRAARRNSERRDDCNSRNLHSEFSLYSGFSSCLFLCSISKIRIDIDHISASIPLAWGRWARQTSDHEVKPTIGPYLLAMLHIIVNHHDGGGR